MRQNVLETLFSTRRSVATIAGTLLSSLGFLMLVRDISAASQGFHWWALFIVLPVLLFFGLAWALAREPVHYRYSLALFGLGLIVLTVAAVFLLNLDWEHWWPLMVVSPMLTLLLLGLPDSTLAQKPEATAWVSLLAWIGSVTLLLGLVFLAGNFRLVDLTALAGRWGWWSVFILICALGAAFNGVWLWAKTGALRLSVMGLFLIANILLVSAIFECFQLNRLLQLPWLGITSGVLLLLYVPVANWRRA
jgi:hypothetical protein